MINLLASCAEFNPDLYIPSTGGTTGGTTGGISSGGTDVGNSSGEGSSGGTTEGSTSSSMDMGAPPSYCGDGILDPNNGEFCDMAAGVPLCSGVGEMSCVNNCTEINTTGCNDMGLDPNLTVPEQGVPCDMSNDNCKETAGPAYTCHLATPSLGLCDTCEDYASCGITGMPCTKPSDCELALTCYNNTCVGMCEFASPACGAQTCTSVGHPTHGVCL